MELAVYLFGVMSGVFVAVAAMHAFQLRRAAAGATDVRRGDTGASKYIADATSVRWRKSVALLYARLRPLAASVASGWSSRRPAWSTTS